MSTHTMLSHSHVRTGALFILLMWIATPALAQRSSGSIGLGGQIGSPSGVTLKIYNPAAWSYDFLAAWDLDDFFFLNVHALRERHLGTTQNVHFFYGPGGFIGIRDRDRPGNDDDEVEAGVSGTFGLGVLIDQFEIYAQITPRLSVVPETDGDIGGGLGFRFYFP